MSIQAAHERFNSLFPLVDAAIAGMMAAVFATIIRFGYGTTETATVGLKFTLVVTLIAGILYLLYRAGSTGYPWLVDQLQAWYRAYQRHAQWEDTPE